MTVVALSIIGYVALGVSASLTGGGEITTDNLEELEQHAAWA